MQVGKELLLDKLSPEVRQRVVWRPDYWLTGEAISTYIRSAGLFGNEMHSPIMCIGHGVPAIVCRWGEQTSKGYMWEDIGLGEWLFNMDSAAEVREIVPAILKMANDAQGAKQLADAARKRVEQLQRETMAILRNTLESVFAFEPPWGNSHTRQWGVALTVNEAVTGAIPFCGGLFFDWVSH
jgi:hypothetical protein